MYRAENYLCPIVLLFHKRALVGVRADLDGSRHGGILLILGFVRRRCRSLPLAIQPLTLDDGRKILIADIQIDVAVDAIYTALLGILPDAVSAAIIGLVTPVCQQDRIPGLDIIGGMRRERGYFLSCCHLQYLDRPDHRACIVCHRFPCEIIVASR